MKTEKAERWVSLSTFCSNKGRGGSKASNPDKIYFAIYKEKKANRLTLNIKIPFAIVAKSNLRAKDLVDIVVDKQSKMMLVRRASQGRWTLSKTSNSLCVKLVWQPGMPSVPEGVFCDYTIDDDGLVFELPSNTSFEKNVVK